jgi:two-component system LytT family sensor kinase
MWQILYNMWKTNLKSIKLHVICWSIFILYEVLVTGVITGHFSPFLNYLLFYVVNIALFYIHGIYIFPFCMIKSVHSVWRLPIIIIAEVTGYILLIVIVTKILNVGSQTPMYINKQFVTATIWRGTYFMLYGTAYYFLINYLKKGVRIYQEAIEIERLKNQLLITQKDFLRAQINPHLLFNTLNFIKYAAKKRPEDAEEAIMILSDIMSFSLDRDNRDYIVLSHELKQIHNMITLNQLRYENGLSLNYRTDILDEGLYIIPIVLLTLTENIFKHGNLLVKENPASIDIHASKEGLKYYSSNLTADAGSLISERNKCGLKNIESRLEAYYPGNFHFSYGMIEDMYVVNLSINFQACN